jgi:CDP-glucose 4,6-dehydratase
MTVDRDFWRGKRVFITGHTGFKGAWLSLWLRQLGAELTGYALPPPTEPNLFTLAGVREGMRCVEGDLLDLDALVAAMHRFQPEIVIHMAAQSLVRRSYAFPTETFAVNALGTAHVLEAARQYACQAEGLRVILNITSDKCYENHSSFVESSSVKFRDKGLAANHSPVFREGDPLGAADPYSASKACAELIAGAYRRSFFNRNFPTQGSINSNVRENNISGARAVRLASCRAGNVIGGGDWAADRLLPDMIRAFARRETASIRSPEAVRPWQHVLEPLSGYLRLAEYLWRMEPGVEEASDDDAAWNFGPAPEDERPVAWLADRAARLWGERAGWRAEAAVSPMLEAPLLRLDCTKARARLGWLPSLNLESALEWTIRWYRGWLDKADLRTLTLADIERYEELSTSLPLTSTVYSYGYDRRAETPSSGVEP